jgi:hypothetical protein
MAKSAQCHDGQALLLGLKANVGSIQMKPQLRFKYQRRVSPDDQHSLVERRNAGRQVGAIAEQTAAIFHPADSFGGERLCTIIGRDHLTDPINSRDPNRPEPPFGCANLLRQAFVPTVGQKNILMHTHDPSVLGLGDGQVERGGGAGGAVDRQDLMGRARPGEARRRLQIGLEDRVVGDAQNERQGNRAAVARTPANPVRGGRDVGRPVGHGDQRRFGLTAHVAEKFGVEWPEAVGVPKLSLV